MQSAVAPPGGPEVVGGGGAVVVGAGGGATGAAVTGERDGATRLVATIRQAGWISIQPCALSSTYGPVTWHVLTYGGSVHIGAGAGPVVVGADGWLRWLTNGASGLVGRHDLHDQGAMFGGEVARVDQAGEGSVRNDIDVVIAVVLVSDADDGAADRPACVGDLQSGWVVDVRERVAAAARLRHDRGDGARRNRARAKVPALV